MCRKKKQFRTFGSANEHSMKANSLLPLSSRAYSCFPAVGVFFCRYAKSINAIHVHTSAKQGKGLDGIFTALSRAIMAKQSSGSRSVVLCFPLVTSTGLTALRTSRWLNILILLFVFISAKSSKPSITILDDDDDNVGGGSSGNGGGKKGCC